MNQAFVLPWPPSRPAPLPLASRPEKLAGARVVIVDNGRLAHPVYQGFHQALTQLLLRQHAEVIPLSYPLISYATPQIKAAAREIAAQRPQAALLALGEAGISQPTVELAIELEALGIATVGLYIDPGVAMARAVAATLMPGLPVIDLNIRPHEFKGRSDEIVATISKRVIDAMSQAPASSGDGAVPLFPATADVVQAWNKAAAQNNIGDAALEFLRACESLRIGDGLPLIPPTANLVRNMCAAIDSGDDTVLIPALPPGGIAITVELAAVNAVMAGCEPHHFACVVAALRAMSAPQYRLAQSVVTTHPGTNVLFFSGALAEQAGISSGPGCLGPGQRANLSIGRAINLCMMNTVRSLPGLTDLGTLGSTAELATCFSDRAFGNWPAYHQDVADDQTSTVFVHRCAPLVNVMDHVGKTAEAVLGSIAGASATIGWNNAYCPTELLVVLCPDHAEIIQQQGWSRADVQQYLFEYARNPRHLLQGRGFAPSWPAWFDALDPVPVVRHAEDILVVVAGGQGPQSQVGLPWGLSQPAWLAVDRDLRMRPFTPGR